MSRLEAVSSAHLAHVALSSTSSDTVALATRENRTDTCAHTTIALGVVSTTLSVASSLAGLVTLGGAFLAGALGCYTIGTTVLCLGSDNESSRPTPFTPSATDSSDVYRRKGEEFDSKREALRKKREALPFKVSNPVETAERAVEREKLWVGTYEVDVEEQKYEKSQAQIRVNEAQRHELYSGQLASAKDDLDYRQKLLERYEEKLNKSKDKLKELEKELEAAKQEANKPVPVVCVGLKSPSDDDAARGYSVDSVTKRVKLIDEA